MPTMTNKIAFQGEPGANSDTACRNVYPDMEPLPCPTFEDAFNAVETGKADLAMIPIENTIAGRVADIHHLLPESKLHIVGEYFLPIHFQLMVLPGVKRAEIKTVHSHIHALGQCRKYIRKNGWKPMVAGDTAGAAKLVAGGQGPDDGGACAASRRRALRPRHPGGECRGHRKQRHPLRRAVQAQGLGRTHRPRDQDDDHLRLPRAQRAGGALQGDGRLRHQWRQHDQARKLPARRHFTATQFYADVEGHPDDRAVKRALEELHFFSREVRILGVYPANEFRATQDADA